MADVRCGVTDFVRQQTAFFNRLILREVKLDISLRHCRRTEWRDLLVETNSMTLRLFTDLQIEGDECDRDFI
jgi:hypothetical protein